MINLAGIFACSRPLSYKRTIAVLPTLTSSTTTTKTMALALVAGEGRLPAVLAKSAQENGYRLVATALPPGRQTRVQPHCDKTYRVAPGQLGRSLKILREENLTQIVFVGKVPKLQLLHNMHKLDWMAIKELSKLPNFNDDTIQFAMGDLVESHGIKVLRQSDFLRHLFPDYGVLTNRQPSAGEYADIQYGFEIAKEIARLDIGQTVIVKDQMVLAIEAIEGTDQAIRRAVELARGPVVVCKVSKPNQDQRFDIPTVGMNTMNSMVAPKPGGVLGIEARETMFVDEQEMWGL